MRIREEILGGLTVRIVGEGRGPVIVLLHGFGAPGTDLVPFAGEIEVPEGTRFVFPEAPLTLPFEIGAGVGRAWWHIDVMRLQMALLGGRVRELRDEVPEGMAEANALVNAMLRELEPALGMERERMILGGFSQGGMLACDVTLRSSEPLAGLVVMSGTYLAARQWDPLMAGRRGLPVFMSHGRDDPLLPFELAEALRDAFETAGLEVSWVPFAGGHGVAPSVVEPLGAFLRRCLAR